MEEDLFNIPLQDVKRELRCGIIECQKRGLVQSAKWLSEMNHGLPDVECERVKTNSASSNLNTCFSFATPRATKYSSAENGNEADSVSNPCQFLEDIAPAEYDNYFLAKSYFDVREYDRAAYFLRTCESRVPRFLHLYATYMAREKRRLDSTTDQSNLNDTGYMRDLAELLALLRAEYSRGRLDGYGLYLYGVVLKTLNLNQMAIQVLVEAIRATPMLWAAYVELSPLITEKEKMLSLNFGGHWMRHIFVAHTFIELYLNDEGLKAYEELQNAGFRKCVYVTSQMALAYHNKRDVEKAIEIFQALQEADPYRLDNMDTYSNLLFVKELKTEMAQLAHKAVGINKYCPETCCVIGNYYSIRCDHQMAIMYFQRALKLNPKYLSAWTLMGHEFMELKNTNAAIQSYRKAVEVNKRDYRAWYGLGQSYEILKMHYYSLYYFKIAHQLRPYDSRMLVALGETYEKLDKCDNAIKCYWKACDVGDIEGVSMYKLANIHEKLGEFDNAVQCYVVYCEDERSASDKQSLFHGYMTLANYYESKGQYDRAAYYAHKCLESDDRKSEAKSLLKTIENKRSGKTITTDTTPVAASGATSKSAISAAAVANADTSSDDDMDLDISDVDYKYSNNDNYVLSSRKTNPAAVPSDNLDTQVSASSGPTNSTLNLGARHRITSVSDDMSLSESDLGGTPIASTSAAALQLQANRAAALAVAAPTSSSAIAKNTTVASSVVLSDDCNEDDDEEGEQSMEISAVSID